MNELGRTPEERLAALDPATGHAYQHADMTSMVARITAVTPATKAPFAPRFRLRMASAAAAAALVSVGGIVALQSAAPSFSAFSLGAAAQTPDGANLPDSDVMRLAANYQFVAGPDLTSGSTLAPTYVLAPPSDFAAASANVAAAFSVSGSPSSAPAANSYWTVSDSSNDSVSYWSDAAVINWNYSWSQDETISPPTPPASTSDSAPALSDAAALSDAQALLGDLGVTVDFGAPTYSEENWGNGPNLTDVSLPVDVGGVSSGYGFDFTFDPTGSVVDADGEVLSISAGPAYPLLSEVAGVSVVQTQYANGYFRGGPILYSPTPTTTPTGNSGNSGSTGVTNNVSSLTEADPSTTVPSGDSGNSGASGDSGTTGTLGDSGVSGDSGTLGSAGDSGSSGNSGFSGDSGNSGTPSSTTVPTIPTITVVLDSASIQYSTYTLSEGSEVLLAQYVYVGNDGSTWTVLAVDPAYVQIAPSSSGGGVAVPLLAPNPGIK